MPTSKKVKETSSSGFSEEELAAIKARATELKKEGRRGEKSAADEQEVLAKIAAMEASDRAAAERLHVIITSAAPELLPKLWYGQPAYARKGKVVCFFRSGHADKERYSTFGFTPEANLDEAGGVWPTSYAVADVSDETASMITTLVKRAIGEPPPPDGPAQHPQGVAANVAGFRWAH